MRDKIAVGIIDDHNMFRSGISEIVNDSDKYKVVISVSDSKQLFEELSIKVIQILLLDIRLKDEDGLDILEKMKVEHPLIKVVMLTMHNESSYINTFVQAGASGYLTKDNTPYELMNTLEKVLEFGKYFNTKTTNILVDSIQSKSQLLKSGIKLSDLELQILDHISQGRTAEEISQIVFKSARTVEGYRQKLLIKTNTKNVAELVAWGYQKGILS